MDHLLAESQDQDLQLDLSTGYAHTLSICPHESCRDPGAERGYFPAGDGALTVSNETA